MWRQFKVQLLASSLDRRVTHCSSSVRREWEEKKGKKKRKKLSVPKNGWDLFSQQKSERREREKKRRFFVISRIVFEAEAYFRQRSVGLSGLPLVDNWQFGFVHLVTTEHSLNGITTYNQECMCVSVCDSPFPRVFYDDDRALWTRLIYIFRRGSTFSSSSFFFPSSFFSLH